MFLYSFLSHSDVDVDGQPDGNQQEEQIDSSTIDIDDVRIIGIHSLVHEFGDDSVIV